MYNNPIRYAALTACGLALTLAAAGQTSQNDEKVISKQVEVVRNYVPTVGQAAKLDMVQSQETAAPMTIPVLNYSIRYKPEAHTPQLSPLSAPVFTFLIDSTLYKGYAEAALGGPLQSRANAYLTSGYDKDIILGLGLNHYGFYGKLKNLAGDKISGLSTTNRIFASLQYTKNRFQVGLKGSVDYDAYSRYGFYAPEGKTLSENHAEEDSVKQHFFKAAAEIYLGTPFDRSGTFDIRFYSTIHYITDKFKFSENSVDAGLVVQKRFERPKAEHTVVLNTEYNYIAKNDRFSVVPLIPYIAGDYTGTIPPVSPDETEKATMSPYSSLYLMPHYRFRNKRLDITAGVKIYASLSGFKYYDEKKANIYPVLHAKLNTLGGRLIPFAEIDGGLRYNSYYNLVRQNPYVRTGLTAPNTSGTRFQGGIQGTLGSLFEYRVYGGLDIVRDLLLFVNTGEGNVFSVTTGDYDVKRAGVELTFDLNDRFRITGSWELNKYRSKAADFTVDRNRVYGLPEHKGSLGFGYSDRRWKAGIKAEVLSERWFRQQFGDETHITREGAAVNLSVNGEYAVSKRFYVQLELNNLLNRKLYPYNLYRGIGFNALAGVGFRF